MAPDRRAATWRDAARFLAAVLTALAVGTALSLVLVQQADGPLGDIFRSQHRYRGSGTDPGSASRGDLRAVARPKEEIRFAGRLTTPAPTWIPPSLRSTLAPAVEQTKFWEHLGRPKEKVALCKYHNNYDGESTIMMEMITPAETNGHIVRWTDQRVIIMNGWRTNRMTCHVELPADQDGNFCQAKSGLQGNPPDACTDCPCTPTYAETFKKYRSPYITDLRAIIEENRCRFRKAVLIGLGVGAMQAALEHTCPEMSLTSVDIDAGAATVVHKFFGYNDWSKITIEDGLKYFQQAASRGDQFDLISIDCFERGTIPAPCRTASIWAAIKQLLTPGGAFIMNTLTVVDWQDDMTKATAGPKAKSYRRGQWWVIQSPQP